jgi:hypothetical protein
MGRGVEAGTEAGRTEVGAVERTRLGAGEGIVTGAGTGGGPLLGSTREYDSAGDSFTMTRVPSGALSKKMLAIPAGTRMQPCEAA